MRRLGNLRDGVCFFALLRNIIYIYIIYVYDFLQLFIIWSGGEII